jgi:hypothetical protein
MLISLFDVESSVQNLLSRVIPEVEASRTYLTAAVAISHVGTYLHSSCNLSMYQPFLTLKDFFTVQLKHF